MTSSTPAVPEQRLRTLIVREAAAVESPNRLFFTTTFILLVQLIVVGVGLALGAESSPRLIGALVVGAGLVVLGSALAVTFVRSGRVPPVTLRAAVVVVGLDAVRRDHRLVGWAERPLLGRLPARRGLRRRHQ